MHVKSTTGGGDDDVRVRELYVYIFWMWDVWVTHAGLGAGGGLMRLLNIIIISGRQEDT